MKIVTVCLILVLLLVIQVEVMDSLPVSSSGLREYKKMSKGGGKGKGGGKKVIVVKKKSSSSSSSSCGCSCGCSSCCGKWKSTKRLEFHIRKPVSSRPVFYWIKELTPNSFQRIHSFSSCRPICSCFSHSWCFHSHGPANSRQPFDTEIVMQRSPSSTRSTHWWNLSFLLLRKQTVVSAVCCFVSKILMKTWSQSSTISSTKWTIVLLLLSSAKCTSGSNRQTSRRKQVQ